MNAQWGISNAAMQKSIAIFAMRKLSVTDVECQWKVHSDTAGVGAVPTGGGHLQSSGQRDKRGGCVLVQVRAPGYAVPDDMAVVTRARAPASRSSHCA